MTHMVSAITFGVNNCSRARHSSEKYDSSIGPVTLALWKTKQRNYSSRRCDLQLKE